MALDNIPTLGPGSLNSNLDKVLVYKNGGSEVAVSLLTLTNSALSISGVYLDTVNQRVGVNTNSPSVPFEVLGNALINAPASTDAILSIGNPTRRWDVKALQSGAYYQLVYQSNGVIGQSIDYLGNVAFGNVATLGARVGIKGSGSTSATSSLLVQNSSGAAALQVTDDNKIAVGNTIYQSFTSSLTNVILSTHTSSSINNTGIYAPGGNAFGVVVNGTRKAYVSGHWQMNGGVIAQADGTSAGLDNSAILEAISTTQGFLKPRMTTTQKNAIATPAAGLEVFDTTLGRPCFYNGTSWITL